MKVLIYYPPSWQEEQPLQELHFSLQSVAPGSNVEMIRNIETLKNVLLQYRREDPMVILTVTSIDEVNEIKAIKDLIEGLFVIVFIGDDTPELSRHCQDLYPRLLVKNSLYDFELVKSVVSKKLDDSV